MNHSIRTTLPMNVISQAIWDGQAIMGMDGSVKAKIATYSWVLSLTSTNVTTDVKGSRFLPPTAQYLQPCSKRPEAAVLFASLSWINDLLQAYPNANPDPNILEPWSILHLRNPDM
jgi:hypothetical protein